MLDQPQPAVLPITVSAEDYQQMMTYLMECPAKLAIPLIQFFQAAQATAQSQASEPKDAPVSHETPPPVRKKR